MINVLTSIADTPVTEKIEGAGNVLSYGGQMMLIGMTIVFAVLTIIWICIVGLKYLLNNNQQAASSETNHPKETHQFIAPSSANDAEIIAVISAAIAAAESESNGLKFRVVSFRRK